MKFECIGYDDNAIREMMLNYVSLPQEQKAVYASKISDFSIPVVDYVLQKSYPSFIGHYEKMRKVSKDAIIDSVSRYNLSDGAWSGYIMPIVRQTLRNYVYKLPTIELLKIYHNATEKEQSKIMEAIVIANDRLILHIIGKYYSSYRHNYMEDMVQQGRMAIFLYAPHFDFNKINQKTGKPYRFSTFISPYILDAIKSFVCDTHNISPHYAVQLKKFNKALEKLRANGIENPTISDIAEEMGVGIDAVQKAFNISSRLNIISIDGDEKEKRLSDPYIGSPDYIVEQQELHDAVHKAIMNLTEEQRRVVYATFFSEERKEASLVDVSHKLNMDIVRVRRILNQAKRALSSCKELRYLGPSQEMSELEDYTNSFVIEFVLPSSAVEANLEIAMSIDDLDDCI